MSKPAIQVNCQILKNKSIMKKNMYWFVMAVAVVMSAMTFVSCEDPFEEVLPEVIESEVLDEGVEEEIIETPSVDPEGTNTGTELSYKSWIMVKGQTRAAFEERVEVTLTNVFNNTDTTVVVDKFELSKYTTSLSHKVRKTREDGFVDIVDSVLVYTVSFENFSFDYELDYEVATYDDGYTKQVMPYHQIGTIKDKGVIGYRDLDFVIEEGNAVYVRKLLTHAISVEFQGKTYDLTANVELRRFVGHHPCVVGSANTGANMYFTGNEVVSTLNMKRKWSDGTEKEEEVTCRMQVYFEPPVTSTIYITGYQNDLAIVSSGLVENEGEAISTEDFVTIYRDEHTYYVNYNYFTFNMKFVKDRAYYDDGFVKREFPNLEVNSFTNSEPVVNFLNTGSDDNGNYSVYMLYQTVTGKISNLTFEATGSQEFTAYE